MAGPAIKNDEELNGDEKDSAYVRKAANLKYLLYSAREINQIAALDGVFKLLAERLVITFEDLRFCVCFRNKAEHNEIKKIISSDEFQDGIIASVYISKTMMKKGKKRRKDHFLGQGSDRHRCRLRP